MGKRTWNIPLLHLIKRGKMVCHPIKKTNISPKFPKNTRTKHCMISCKVYSSPECFTQTLFVMQVWGLFMFYVLCYKNFNKQFLKVNNTILYTTRPELYLGSLYRLYLYYGQRRDIQWNIAWAEGKSGGRSLRDFPRAQPIIQTCLIPKRYTSSIVLPGRAILEQLILCIGLAAGAIFPRSSQ